ncbi:MAG: ATP-binding protein [Cyanobacteria bacterium P01_F01_bin.42]
MKNLCKVLIIDDCEEDLAVYRRYLQADSGFTKYKIQATASAEEALSLCEVESFDVILLDYELPELSGLEFLDWSSQALSDVAIIMLSAYGDESLAVRALKRGAQDYLVKQSLTPDILTNAIRASITQVRLQEQLQQSREQQQLISNVALKIRDSLDLAQVLETSVAEIRKLLKCDRVLIFQQSTPVTQRIVAESVNPECQASAPRLSEIQGSLMAQHSAQHPNEIGSWQIENIAAATLDSDVRQALQHLDVVSLLEVPIAIEWSNAARPKLWGALVLHECRQRAWQPVEQDMLQKLCVHLAIAIQQSELLTQTQCALIKEQELNQFKSKIVATVSHEYRTPITSILASAATLERHSDRLETAQNQRLLALIAQQARHLRELVDDMLVVNQVELGQIQFKPFPLNLEQFFERLIEQYEVVALKSHEISLAINGDFDSFMGDFGLCRQIFGNLLSNALKYSPQGGPIELTVDCGDEEVTVTIRDCGIGIPTDDISQLFQSFSRGSNVDTITGTGLGLSIAKACVELHQGKLSIKSQAGDYTEAQVTLPRRPNLSGAADNAVEHS